MSQTIATVTIRRASRMTKRGRRSLAAWLRRHAKMLERQGDRYSDRFTGRYIIPSRG